MSKLLEAVCGTETSGLSPQSLLAAARTNRLDFRQMSHYLRQLIKAAPSLDLLWLFCWIPDALPDIYPRNNLAPCLRLPIISSYPEINQTASRLNREIFCFHSSDGVKDCMDQADHEEPESKVQKN